MIQALTFRRKYTGTISAGGPGLWLPVSGTDPMILPDLPVVGRTFTVISAHALVSLSISAASAPNVLNSGGILITRGGDRVQALTFFEKDAAWSTEYCIIAETAPGTPYMDAATGEYKSYGLVQQAFPILQPVLRVLPSEQLSLYGWVHNNGGTPAVDLAYELQAHISLTVED